MRLFLILTVSAAVFACSKADTQTKEPEAKPAAAPAAKPAAEAPTPTPVAGDAAAAPDFTLKDQDGNDVTLSSFRGKTVVLEWFNPGCPFVKYAHGDGPLKDQAARHEQSGIVWLAINSGAPGKQGHGLDLNKSAAKEWGMTHPILFDEDGTVGKLYGAKTTPHMYVVNAEGNLVYRGALDNAPMGNAEGDVVNYVDQALAALAKGEPPPVAEMKSYGCSVKYGE